MTHWQAVLECSVPLFPGIAGVLAQLRTAGVRLGICTASQGESFRPLEQPGLLGMFDEVVTARDVERRKPHPERILLCMERMGVAAEEAIYVGGTVADIRASRAAGLFAVGVLTGAGNSSLLSGAGAHRVLPDLQDLPGLLPGGAIPRAWEP
jgi:phosphoglycolate phosphatase